MIRSLRLKFACDEDWDAFPGAGGVRRCATCSTSVHDLSTLTRSEAMALFERPPAGGLCVRYEHDGEGRVLFRSERRPGQLVWQRFVPPPAPASSATSEPGAATGEPEGTTDATSMGEAGSTAGVAELVPPQILAVDVPPKVHLAGPVSVTVTAAATGLVRATLDGEDLEPFTDQGGGV